MKKIAVLIYPHFSLQEITCLTSALTVWFERSIDVYASSKDIITSEDGFQCIAAKTTEEWNPDDYECLVLPGILNPLPALFDEKLIAFLRGLAGKELLIASISSSPLLLAKAGLLKDVRFTSGVWEEILQHLDFVPKANIVHRPLMKDGNIITAHGLAFREFAEEVIKALGLDDCEDRLFKGMYRDFTEEELTFSMGEDNFKEFLDEYNGYMNG